MWTRRGIEGTSIVSRTGGIVLAVGLLFHLLAGAVGAQGVGVGVGALSLTNAATGDVGGSDAQDRSALAPKRGRFVSAAYGSGIGALVGGGLAVATGELRDDAVGIAVLGGVAGAVAGLALPLQSDEGRDRTRGARRGFGVGALVGGLALAGTYSVTATHAYDDFTLGLLVVGAVIGGAAGGMVGLALGTDGELPASSKLRIEAFPVISPGVGTSTQVGFRVRIE